VNFFAELNAHSISKSVARHTGRKRGNKVVRDKVVKGVMQAFTVLSLWFDGRIG
jgi:hypothetical protein